MTGVFITGTGTDVGKTHVTGLLLRGLRVRGVNAGSIKPVQTGCAPGEPPLDLAAHWRLAGWQPAESVARACAPFVFADPVSPHLAAQRAGVRLDVAVVAEAVRAAARHFEFSLVEGAGGVLVPLNECETQLDLMRALALPVLLVAEAGVGTINHTLLTLAALRGAGVPVLGVVLNARVPVAEAGVAEDNAATIAAMGACPVFGIVGPRAGLDGAEPEALTAALAAFAGEGPILK